jgi:hypothetical protein
MNKNKTNQNIFSTKKIASLICIFCAVNLLSCRLASGSYSAAKLIARKNSLVNTSNVLINEIPMLANPANIAKRKKMDFSKVYSKMNGFQLVGDLRIADTQDNLLLLKEILPLNTIGICYSRHSLDSLYQETLLSLSYGVNILNSASLGISISGISTEYSTSDLSPSGNNSSEFNYRYDCGFLVDFKRVTLGMSLGISNQPKFALDKELIESEGLQVNLTGKYQYKKTNIHIESLFSSSENRISTKIEQIIFANSVYLNSRIVCCSSYDENISLGIGWKSEIFSIGCTFNHSLSRSITSGSCCFSITL